MKKKKIFFIILTIILSYAIFAGTIILLFNLRRDPLDELAFAYISNNSEFENEYGEVDYIIRNVEEQIVTEEYTIKCPYSIETNIGRFKIHVVFTEDNNKYKAVGYEFIEVITDEYSN